MKLNYTIGPSLLPGAQALPSAWWPGAACPSQSQMPPQHGADPQMTGGCSHTLQLPSHTGCPFQSRARLKERQKAWGRIAISVKCVAWCKMRQNPDCSVYSPTTKMIFASLILSEMSMNKRGLQVHTMCHVQRLYNQINKKVRFSGKNIFFCNKPSRQSYEEKRHSVESAVHVFPIV